MTAPESFRERLISRLGRAHASDTGFTDDLDMMPPGTAVRDAAVLIPIVVREVPQVLLTLRPDHLPRHPGQIAFPGGRIDPIDESPRAAALREAQEEVGLEPRFVDVAGSLAPFITGTGYRVMPFVGLVDPGYDLKIDEREVVEAFEVPFDFLMNPAHHVRKTAEFRGRTRSFYEMNFGRHRIWGVTAGIIVDLYRTLYTGTP